MLLKRPAITQTDRECMKKTLIIGWIIEFAGTALWLYGYFATGSPPVINWHATAPAWISEFFG